MKGIVINIVNKFLTIYVEIKIKKFTIKNYQTSDFQFFIIFEISKSLHKKFIIFLKTPCFKGLQRS